VLGDDTAVTDPPVTDAGTDPVGLAGDDEHAVASAHVTAATTTSRCPT
jgi:hypothetical protein